MAAACSSICRGSTAGWTRSPVAPAGSAAATAARLPGQKEETMTAAGPPAERPRAATTSAATVSSASKPASVGRVFTSTFTTPPPLDLGVVGEHQPPVGRPPDVELHPVGPAGQGPGEGGQGVLPPGTLPA